MCGSLGVMAILCSGQETFRRVRARMGLVMPSTAAAESKLFQDLLKLVSLHGSRMEKLDTEFGPT
jgi:hypothetical protein